LIDASLNVMASQQSSVSMAAGKSAALPELPFRVVALPADDNGDQNRGFAIGELQLTCLPSVSANSPCFPPVFRAAVNPLLRVAVNWRPASSGCMPAKDG